MANVAKKDLYVYITPLFVEEIPTFNMRKGQTRTYNVSGLVNGEINGTIEVVSEMPNWVRFADNVFVASPPADMMGTPLSEIVIRLNGIEATIPVFFE